MLGELLRAAEAGEAAADDHHMALAVGRAHELRRPLARSPGAATDIRSSRWSPTRSALAIAVSAGFTAPMLGKKLVSTT